MILLDAYSVRPEIDALSILYALFLERPRENWISTTAIPTTEQHKAFFDSRPYFAWYLIRSLDHGFVGSIYLGHDNSIGVAVLESYQRQGFGSRAVKMLMEKHEPLTGLPSRRSAHFVANIALGNQASTDFFAKLGFKTAQTVMVKK